MTGYTTKLHDYVITELFYVTHIKTDITEFSRVNIHTTFWII